MISKVSKTLKLAKDLKLNDIILFESENAFDRIYTHYINPYTDKPNNVFLAFKYSSKTLCVASEEPFWIYSPDSQVYKLYMYYYPEDHLNNDGAFYTWMISEEINRERKKYWKFNYKTHRLYYKK